jgi:hypothetical protein
MKAMFNPTKLDSAREIYRCVITSVHQVKRQCSVVREKVKAAGWGQFLDFTEGLNESAVGE